MPKLPFDDKNREEIVTLYSEWCKNNRPSHLYRVGLLGLVFQFVFLGVDWSFFRQSAYAILHYRLFLIAVFLGVTAISRWGKFKSEWIWGSLLIIPTILTNYVYLLMLSNKNGPYFQVWIIAVMVMWISTYFLQKFWREQYILTGSTCILLVLLSRMQILNEITAYSLVSWSICCSLVAFMDRRSFSQIIFDRFSSLRVIVPMCVAKHMTVANENTNLETAFSPRLRYFSCVCADWRGFQQCANLYPPEVVERGLEFFHETIFYALQEAVPDKTYYMDWTADEIFITIFSESDDLDEVKSKTLRFVQHIALEVPKKLLEFEPIDIRYDVGASIGKGLLGLLGPKMMKKTGSMARVGGEAKRYETEAKEFRKKVCSDINRSSRYPYVIISSELFSAVKTIKDYPLQFQSAVALTKDIVNSVVFRFHQEDGERNEEMAQSHGHEKLKKVI
jgi:hypothetical protein